MRSPAQVQNHVREKDEASNDALDLYDTNVSDDQLIDAMIKRPILINRPIVP